MSLGDWLFNPSGLTPHGFCLLWVPGLIYLHAISDGVIALAYFSIPLALASLTSKRKDLEYGWVVQLFVAFILACGTTHLLSIVTLWFPIYGIEGIVKGVTAVLSIATAFLLWPLIPKLIAIPSPRQLQELNAQLSAKIEEQRVTAELLQASEKKIREINLELEKRVDERTQQLTDTNRELTAIIAQRDLLIREVYHRVKNNLQIIDSIVTLQARKLSDPSAKQALASLRKRLFALGLVHHQLMSSNDLQTFDMAPFLRDLTENIIDGSADGKIGVNVTSFPLNVGLDFAIPVGLLVTELVTNSIKHAFPDGGGHIDVSLRKGDGQKLILTIADDGLWKAASEGQNDGLGGTIVAGLVQQLRATMSVSKAQGTSYEIVFDQAIAI